MQSLAVALIGLFASLLAVEGAQLQRPAGECLDNSFASSNTFPSPFRVIAAPQTGGTAVNTTVKFAQGFEVTYFPTYKLVTNLIAYGGPFSYALYQCGMQPPAASLLPNNTKIFSIPLSSIAVEDTTMLSIVEILGLQARVSYVTEYAVNPCMQSLGLSGCGRLTSGAANGYTDLNATQVGDLDGILGYQATPKTIAVTASADPGPLNRAEWIKFVATFFNREDVANALFDQIAQHYNSIKSAVASQAFMGARKPVVAWVLYNPAGYGAPDQIQISFATYKINYTVDAGGAMLDLAAANATALKYGTWGKEVSYQYNSLILAYNNTNLAQQLRDILADVDVMIEESRFTTPEMSNANLTMASLMSFYGFTAADQQNLKFLKNSMVVREDVQSNPAGFTDWLEMAIVQPDVVLRDLTSLVTPAAITTNDPPRFLRRLGVVTPTVLQSSQCPLKNCLLSSAPGYINDPICPLVYRDCSGNIVAATPQQRCAPVCNSPGVSGPALAPPPIAASINTPTLASLALACLLALIVAVAM